MGRTFIHFIKMPQSPLSFFILLPPSLTPTTTKRESTWKGSWVMMIALVFFSDDDDDIKKFQCKIHIYSCMSPLTHTHTCVPCIFNIRIYEFFLCIIFKLRSGLLQSTREIRLLYSPLSVCAYVCKSPKID